MDKLFEGKYRGTTEEEEDEIRDKLYTFSQQLKKANFDSTNYSNLFFNKLKEVIVFSDKFQKQNMKYSIQDFFTYTDQLFEKEITKENEVDRQLMEENYNLFKNEIIPKIKKLFEDKKKTISEIYELGLYRCQRTIDNEIANSDKILKDANNNIELVSQNFEKKIDDIIKEINLKRVNEWNNMEEDIKKVYDNAYIKYYKEKKMNSTKIDINKGITFKMFASVVGSTISGIAIRSGLVMVGESLIAGAGAVTATATTAAVTNSAAIGTALLGPTGVAIGLSVGIVISVGSILYHYFSKSKRYITGLEQTKIDIVKKIGELKEMFLRDFSAYQITFNRKLNFHLGIMRTNINKVDEKKWKQIKENYALEKKKIEERIKIFN